MASRNSSSPVRRTAMPNSVRSRDGDQLDEIDRAIVRSLAADARRHQPLFHAAAGQFGGPYFYGFPFSRTEKNQRL